MSRLAIGWIGCGVHANEMLLPQLVRHDVALAALCDSDAARLAATAARYGVPKERCFSDWKALMAHPGLDAVGAAVGPKLHEVIAYEAIARGLPLFIEKPPAANAAAAARLAAAAAAKKARVVVGFMKRYSTANRIAANVLRAAEFGPAYSFLGEYMTGTTYFAGDVDYSGFFLHHCVHYFDLVPHMMGAVEDISARACDIGKGKLLLHVHFRFAGGGLGALALGTHQSRGTPMEWWQAMGDHRRVEVRNVHEVRYYRDPPFKAQDPKATLADGVDALVWEPNLTAAANEDHKGYHALIAAFLATARGEEVGAPDLADGARAMALLERALGSCGFSLPQA